MTAQAGEHQLPRGEARTTRTFLFDAACATGAGAGFTTAAIRTVAGSTTPRTTFDVSEAMAGVEASTGIARAAKTIFTAGVRGLTV